MWLKTRFFPTPCPSPLAVGMESALLNVRSHGLAHAFLPDDLRQQTCRGLWPGSDMVNDQVLEAKLKELCNCLVADSYGGVDAVKWARNAYNSRLTQTKFFSTLDFSFFCCVCVCVCVFVCVCVWGVDLVAGTPCT